MRHRIRRDVPTERYPIAYAARGRDEEIRKESSSGGVFCLLAKEVIRRGGVVFGAGFDEHWEVAHSYIEKTEDIRRFMGSKYVQSRVGDTYREAEAFLEQGRLVLYSGTPCQIYGLKAYLGKDSECLLTVDMVCHGVPSRKVWRDYLVYRAKGRQITSVNFRDKTEGWGKSSLKIDFENGESYRECLQKDLYLQGFVQDIYLRPSCYECKFKGIKRDTDITLADFWGCERLLPEMFDDRGTSLVLLQSERGEKLWDAVGGLLDSRTVSTAEYEKYNPSLKESVPLTGRRKRFFADSSWENLERIVKRLDSIPKLVTRIKEVIQK